MLIIGQVFFLLWALNFVFCGEAYSKNGPNNGTVCEKVFYGDVYFGLYPLAQQTYFRYRLQKDKTKQGTVTYNIPDYPSDKFNTVDTDADFNANGYDLLFNFCTPVSFFTNKTDPCEEQFNKAPKTFTMLADLAIKQDLTNPNININQNVNQYGDDCTKIKYKEITTDSKYERYNYTLIDEDYPQEGFIYRLWTNHSVEMVGETQNIKDRNTSITYIFRCDSKQEGLNYQGWKYFSNATTFDLYLEVKSKYGCPTLKISIIWQMLEDSNVNSYLQIQFDLKTQQREVCQK